MINAYPVLNLPWAFTCSYCWRQDTELNGPLIQSSTVFIMLCSWCVILCGCRGVRFFEGSVYLMKEDQSFFLLLDELYANV